MHPTAPSSSCAALVVIDRITWSPCAGQRGRLLRNAHTCNWIDDAAQIDAGVYPVEEAYGVSKYRIEYRALDATPTRR